MECSHVSEFIRYLYKSASWDTSVPHNGRERLQLLVVLTNVSRVLLSVRETEERCVYGIEQRRMYEDEPESTVCAKIA